MNLLDKAKILLGLNKAVNEAQRILKAQPHQPMKLKPGIKTSEFWITIAVGIGAVVDGATLVVSLRDSGIGLAMAEAFGAAGMSVMLADIEATALADTEALGDKSADVLNAEFGVTAPKSGPGRESTR